MDVSRGRPTEMLFCNTFSDTLFSSKKSVTEHLKSQESETGQF